MADNVFRQCLVIDVVFTAPESEWPVIDWEGELAQGLNEAGGYRGIIWKIETKSVERLRSAHASGPQTPYARLANVRAGETWKDSDSVEVVLAGDGVIYVFNHTTEEFTLAGDEAHFLSRTCSWAELNRLVRERR